MSIGHIVAGKSGHEKRTGEKLKPALIISTRGNHAQWLLYRGQESLLNISEDVKTNNLSLNPFQ